MKMIIQMILWSCDHNYCDDNVVVAAARKNL